MNNKIKNKHGLDEEFIGMIVTLAKDLITEKFIHEQLEGLREYEKVEAILKGDIEPLPEYNLTGGSYSLKIAFSIRAEEVK